MKGTGVKMTLRDLKPGEEGKVTSIGEKVKEPIL